MSGSILSFLGSSIDPVITSGEQFLGAVNRQIGQDEVSTYERVFHHEMELAFDIIVSVIDVMTVAVIVYGFVYAMVLFVQMHINHRFGEQHASVDLSVIRVKLGSYLLLGLELFIAADIILTIGDPSIEHLTQLAAIVVIRIIITHFLQKEMNELTEDGVHH